MQRYQEMAETFEWLFDPRMPFFFILGGLLFAVMGNSAYDLFILWTGSGPLALLGIFLGSLALLVMAVSGLYAFLRLNRPPPVSLAPEEEAEPRQGLVLFLSKGEGKADEFALNFHFSTLRDAWFIVTDAVQKEGKAGRLTVACRERDVRVQILDLEKPRDAREAYRLVRQTLTEARQRGMGPDSLYVDITGCLRPAAVGATLACRDVGYEIEYVLAQYDDQGRVIGETSKAMKVLEVSTWAGDWQEAKA
jgi:hypothetical protein